MITISYAKLHGDENDFLLTWADEAPEQHLPELARRICARNSGVGADGWMLAWKAEGGLRTRLFNSDGSEAEISGNGTRCAAAFALWEKVVDGPLVVVNTVAGRKELRLQSQTGVRFIFEMNMGLPVLEELHSPMTLAGHSYDATILNVGNPQCAVFVAELPVELAAGSG